MRKLLLLPAAAFLALLVHLVFFPPRHLPVGPAPTPGEGPARAPAVPPPVASFPAPEEEFPAEVPASAATAPAKRDSRPPLVIGRLVDERGEPLARFRVHLSGETLLLRLIENARGPKLETVRLDGGISLVLLPEGVIPLAYPCAKTGADGSFSVPRPPPGEGAYELLFVAPDGAVRARTRPFVPEPDRPTDFGSIVALDAGAITGEVVDEEGRHVPEALVWCLPLDRVCTVPGVELILGQTPEEDPFGGGAANGEALWVVTDGDGRFELADIRPGPVRLFVRGPVSGAVVERVLVSRRATTETRKIVLDRPGAFVSGRVVAGDPGEPVEGVHVFALGTRLRTRTAADGAWRLGPLAPGEAKLMATLGQRVGFSQPIQLIAGRHVTGQTIEISDGD